jgi:hypothetical protein
VAHIILTGTRHSNFTYHDDQVLGLPRLLEYSATTNKKIALLQFPLDFNPAIRQFELNTETNENSLRWRIREAESYHLGMNFFCLERQIPLILELNKQGIRWQGIDVSSSQWIPPTLSQISRGERDKRDVFSYDLRNFHMADQIIDQATSGVEAILWHGDVAHLKNIDFFSGDTSHRSGLPKILKKHGFGYTCISAACGTEVSTMEHKAAVILPFPAHLSRVAPAIAHRQVGLSQTA